MQRLYQSTLLLGLTMSHMTSNDVVYNIVNICGKVCIRVSHSCFAQLDVSQGHAVPFNLASSCSVTSSFKQGCNWTCICSGLGNALISSLVGSIRSNTWLLPVCKSVSPGLVLAVAICIPARVTSHVRCSKAVLNSLCQHTNMLMMAMQICLC